MTAKSAADPETKVPPTPRWVMAVLVVVLLGLAGLTVKMLIFPSPPAAWMQVFETPQMPAAEVNRLFTESHAIMDSVKTSSKETVETWSLQHRAGSWQAEVTLVKSAGGEVLGPARMRCDVTNLPSCTRTWEFSVKSGER